jgi:hypothetical protein
MPMYNTELCYAGPVITLIGAVSMLTLTFTLSRSLLELDLFQS